MQLDVAVIGAGPAGLTAAVELTAAGASVAVFEAGPAVGGMCRSLQLWGHTVDLGPHRFFSKDARVNRFWLDIVGGEYRLVDRTTRILYDRKLFDYPIGIANCLRNLGPAGALAAGLSYARQLAFPEPLDGSFESWVVRRFGRRLYGIFFRPYSEKLWGISCRELDADFAAQRIRRLSFLEAVRGAFPAGRKPAHRTLVDRFAYPRRGTGWLYETMAARVRAAGGTIELGTPVDGLLVESGRAAGLRLADGRAVRAGHVLSTMPLTQLVARLPDAPAPLAAAARALKFRNTILVYLHVDAIGLFPDQWLYVQAPELGAGRVTNFRNWSPDLCNAGRGTVLALEYWCQDEDVLWTAPDDQLARRAAGELAEILAQMGSPAPAVLDARIVRVRRSYPVYRRDYQVHVRVIREHLEQVGSLAVIGRAGAFKYNNQDHSILMGLLAARSITRGERADLWAVNSDTEDYQESSRITEAGLVIEEADRLP